MQAFHACFLKFCLALNSYHYTMFCTRIQPYYCKYYAYCSRYEKGFHVSLTQNPLTTLYLLCNLILNQAAPNKTTHSLSTFA